MPKIFISYSHQDTPIKNQLVTHLGVLQQQGLIESWDDQKIMAGERWQEAIEGALQTAQIAVLLISADFLNSDFITKKEIPFLLQQQAAKKLRIFPIIVRPCAWKSHPRLSEMQVIDAIASNMDQTFTDVANSIYEIINSDTSQQPVEQLNENKSKALSSFQANLPVYLAIEKQGEFYQGGIHQGDVAKAFPLQALEIGPHLSPLKNYTRSLGYLVDVISSFRLDQLDEKFQLIIGQYLYDQTIGQLSKRLQDQLLENKFTDLKVLTRDQWVSVLPWHLLSNRNIFLHASGWSISLSSQPASQESNLSSAIKVLIIAPQPKGSKKGIVRDHLEALEDQLSTSNDQLTFKQNLKLITSWEAYTEAVVAFAPDIVYFYGQTIIQSNAIRLIFADERQAEASKSLAAFCQSLLDKPDHRPSLVYFNICSGQVINLQEDIRQLGTNIPVIISNRALAPEFVLQQQAQNLLYQILIQATPPLQAIKNLYVGLEVNQLATPKIRWTIPWVYSHYKKWNAVVPSRPDRLTRDPNWHLKVDRVNQHSLVMTQTRQMLREQKPRSLVFTWYGQEGQGVEIFHKRLLVELREDLHHAFVYQIRPAWPMHIDNYHSAFSNMFTQAFQVSTLEDIPAQIRKVSHGTHGKQTLVYIRHEPVRSSKLINPVTLKTYIDWWDRVLAPLLDRKQFALLSVSFIVNNPVVFMDCIEQEEIDELDTRHTVFWLLDELERIAKKDLLLFLRTHNIDLPNDRRDKVLTEILKKTEGKYELTIEALKDLQREAWWNYEDKKAKHQEEGRKKFDY